MMIPSVTDKLIYSDRVPLLMIIIGFVLMALAAGTVIATGNVVFIGMALGAMAGVLLLSVLEVAVWLVLVGTLIVCGPILLFAPQYWKISWGFALIGMFMGVAAALAAGTRRQAIELGPMPGFVLLAIAFFLVALLTLALPESRFDEAGPAFKRVFQYFGVIFLFACVPFSWSLIRRLGYFLVFLAILQIPFVIYQRLVLVPLRWNLPQRVVPIDVVTGTFEGTMDAGSANSVMAMLLCLVVTMIAAAYRDRVLRGPVALGLTLLAMAPLGFGETKIVIVLLPLALLMVFADLVRKRPVMFLGGAAVVAAMIGALGWTYLMVQNTDRMNDSLETRIEEGIEYNFGEAGYNGGVSVNRTTAVTFWWRQHRIDDPVTMLLGHGMGSAFPSEGGARGHMDAAYNSVAIGLTAASVLLWEVGLVGCLFYLAMLVMAWLTARRLVARAQPGVDRTLCRVLLASAAMMPVMLFYADFLMHLPSMQVLMTMTLGLIAWRARQR